MATKRFRYKRFIKSRHWCIDRKEKRETQYWDTAIDWLNELANENEQFKEENEQLKQQIKELYNFVKFC